MLCQSDKDSKLILVKMEDYKRRIKLDIASNFTQAKLPSVSRTKQIKQQCRDSCQILHQYDKITSKCLTGAVGLIYKQNKDTYQPTRHWADQFNFDFEKNTAYVYPLWKTHKALPGQTFSHIDQVPMRLVTAANRTPTTKVMSMLEYVLSGPMKNYCAEEYTKDSSHYLQCLNTENIHHTKNLSIICLDVEKLYPSASRSLTIEAVRECLTENSWNPNATEAFVELVELCMKEIYIEFDNETYTAESGIITGAPNSVSLANCMLRYITKRLDTSLALLWKRYIDDIICFLNTRDQVLVDKFIDDAQSQFNKYGLNITFRILNPEFSQNTAIEFLDVNHTFDDLDCVQTSLFIKETAQNSTYLHPSSYHPKFIPRGILKGEFIRIRKLCSNKTTFKSGIQEIVNKAQRSEFPMKTINEVLDEVKTWDSEKRIELLNPEPKETRNKALVWVSQLPTCIKDTFSKSLRKLLPKKPKMSLQIAYQKPASLRTLCFNPKKLEQKEGRCSTCGKCKSCGSRKGPGINMVKSCTHFSVKVDDKIKTFKIKSDLNCKNNGIYVAKCTQTDCEQTYVGKTSTNFSTRISGHRNKWLKADPSEGRDDTALLDHYRMYHSEIYQNWFNTLSKAELVGFDRAFQFVFVDKIGPNLTEQENFWKTQLKSQLNRCNIITPTIT